MWDGGHEFLSASESQPCKKKVWELLPYAVSSQSDPFTKSTVKCGGSTGGAIMANMHSLNTAKVAGERWRQKMRQRKGFQPVQGE